MENLFLPIVISFAVSIVLAFFYARAHRKRPALESGATIFASTVGGNPIRISEDGIRYDSWGFYHRFLKWEDIVELEHNTGNHAITVRGRDGKKIVHALHTAPEHFQRMIQQRTKLPLTVATPGVWKVEKTQVAYKGK